MGKDSVTHRKIIELTREVVHGFYSRSVEHLVHYLSDDFVWIGAFDFQFCTSKEQFLEIIQSELDAIPFEMDDEHYELITRDRDTFVLYCKFKLSNILEDGSLLQMHTRLSVIWKRIDNELKLVHVHGSNAHDIPITTVAPVINEDLNTDDFINYITTRASQMNKNKKMFRLLSGEHCILPESDILYLQADGQNTKVFTEKDCLTITGILRIHEEALSDVFFRMHKSYLINTAYLTAMKRYTATIKNQFNLPISRDKYIELKLLCNKK